MTMPPPHPHTTRSSIKPLLVYLILFHALWAGWVYTVYPWMQTLGERSLLYAVVNVGLRIAVWVVPVFLYLRYLDGVAPVAYLQRAQRWRVGVAVGLGLSAINFVLFLAQRGHPSPSLQAVTWNSILSTSLTIGLVEEVPYRGFISRSSKSTCLFGPPTLSPRCSS
jgi:membrane protease YdiL (CAAX protease family)